MSDRDEMLNKSPVIFNRKRLISKYCINKLDISDALRKMQNNAQIYAEDFENSGIALLKLIVR
jgi:hypothetical protein